MAVTPISSILPECPVSRVRCRSLPGWQRSEQDHRQLSWIRAGGFDEERPCQALFLELRPRLGSTFNPRASGNESPVCSIIFMSSVSSHALLTAHHRRFSMLSVGSALRRSRCDSNQAELHVPACSRASITGTPGPRLNKPAQALIILPTFSGPVGFQPAVRNAVRKGERACLS